MSLKGHPRELSVESVLLCDAVAKGYEEAEGTPTRGP